MMSKNQLIEILTEDLLHYAMAHENERTILTDAIALLLLLEKDVKKLQLERNMR